MSDKAIYSSLEKLIGCRDGFFKYAAEGVTSSVPDDPSGDGTVDPTTGDYTKINDKEIENSPFVDVTAVADSPAFSTDVTANIPNMGTEVLEVDEPVVDEYNLDVPDPGTDTPVKTSSAHFARYTFEQNHAAFNKLAGVLLQDMRELSSGVQKQASYSNPNALYQERLRKAAAIMDQANADANLFAMNHNYVLQKNASGEEITEEDVPVDPSVGVEDIISPEEAEVINELPPETVEALDAMSDPQLDAIEAVVSAVEEGQVDPEEAVAILTGEEPAADPAACADGSCDADTPDSSCEDDPNCESTKEAAFRWLMRKVAEEAPVEEGDLEAAQSLPAEDVAAIEELPPEAIDRLIEIEKDVEEGNIDPEEVIAALEEDPAVMDEADEALADVPADAPADPAVSEAEAVAEMSSAMAEQGVTPEDLEAVAEGSPEVKSAKLHKIARSVRGFRYKYAAHQRSKTARQAALRNRCTRVLNELMSNY